MYSLNVPIPPAIRACRDERSGALEPFETVREPLTLVVKRFGDRSPEALSALEGRLRSRLSTQGPISARIDRIDSFSQPAGGPAPVIYLAVDSPQLEAMHRELVDRYGTADIDIEGAGYVPHVTLARGGPMASVDALVGALEEPITWEIDTLELWSVRYEQPVTTFHLTGQ